MILSYAFITNTLCATFSVPSYVVYSMKNYSFTFVNDNLNMVTALNFGDLEVITIFKNSRKNSYFNNIHEEKKCQNLLFTIKIRRNVGHQLGLFLLKLSL